ncbi:16S rRNA (guanine(966)-N(2))-methyltransferase RsmD [Aliidiomarina minuta]|uniref:16S rRNA (guanine(966)-N(2))-methyltransferase RsmD n=1 Tax=Aliidiomarina minuta TaxID=880057 RepID=UPI001F547E4D|nr:16S rRNA (guanine(966)-N(2))-methyltransferase RsmD [Aliidiomarina minuta]
MAKAQQKGQIRIIGGRWRGRKLAVLHAEGLRPTGDRIKETLFNWIQFDLAGSRVLDLFAGTGSLGFEALSRGAAQATFVETHLPAARQLQENIALLKAEASVETRSAEQLLPSLPANSVDLILIDPPFQQGWLPRIIPLLENSGCLTEHALIYVECERREDFSQWPSNWHLLRDKEIGQVHFRLFTRES